MSNEQRYPKRLIEVDLPIKRISVHARREKDMRRGHVPLLYIWPATRPTAACRAIACAALWPDPADSSCPDAFRREAARLLRQLRDSRGGTLRNWNDTMELRAALLDFIADFSNWDNSTVAEYIDTSRKLTLTAHECLGGALGTKPLIVDPFSGGGAIPLESLRIGADAFASDLNPLAVVFNKLVLEYIPRYGASLAHELQQWCDWAQHRAAAELSQYYPSDPDGSIPIAYLWARTIRCEGPGCGADIPLLRHLCLARKGRAVSLRLVPKLRPARVEFEIVESTSGSRTTDTAKGTVNRGSASCPVCGYTTPAVNVKKQLNEKQGGTEDARLFCVVTSRPGSRGRVFRLGTMRDVDAVKRARVELARRKQEHRGQLSLVPDEPLPRTSGGFMAPPLYGMDRYDLLFTSRQALAITTYLRLAREYSERPELKDKPFSEAVQCLLALAINRLVDLNAALCVWQLNTPNTAHVFGRWALQMVLDFGEVNPLAGAGGSPESVVRRAVAGINNLVRARLANGSAVRASATQHPLPDDSAQAFITDPPYYNAVPYADLSDFFYVWLRRTVGDRYPDLFATSLSPKDEEICEMASWDAVRYPGKDKVFFEGQMRKAMEEGRRILSPGGIGVVVFAHKSTSGWEALLQAVIDAGWIITGSWPIDTEMGSRLRAKHSAALASSVHLVCRPRENPDGSVRTDEIGDWREVLRQLPRRIHEWMPRLAEEGVVGADAIFACLGPALEVFSRYSRVEKANGEVVTLKEYLEQVWAAVAREALSLIFEDADATGLEEDARLTAMWLWTLSAGGNGAGNGASGGEEDEEVGDDEENSAKVKATAGFTLEFDAARKIAQGLGAHLEALTHVVEIKGDKARLLSVTERTRYLFGKDQAQQAPARRSKKPEQLALFEELVAVEKEAGWGEVGLPPVGETTLNRVHQAMILFAAGRGEALKRFLVEGGVGRDGRFWKLAQSLSALYPSGIDEKRWVDGVLARKKGLGFG